MRHILLVLVGTLCVATTPVPADLVPPGHKNARHYLLFEDSPLFGQHRILAAPTAGMRGVRLIEPGEPFRFSSKYGTRFYVLPDDAGDVEHFEPERFAGWVNCPPPRAETKTVPLTSPVERLVTTVRLVRADATAIVVEEVAHAEYDADGELALAVAPGRIAGLVAAGLAVCVVTFLALRRRTMRRVAAAAAAEATAAD